MSSKVFVRFRFKLEFQNEHIVKKVFNLGAFQLIRMF